MQERSAASRIRAKSATGILLLGVLLTSVLSPQASSNARLGRKPSVELHASSTLITLPCPPEARSSSRSCPLTYDSRIPLVAIAKGFNKDAVYSYSVGGGQIVGEGSKVIWDLTGVGPGLYVVKVDVQDTRKRHASSSLTVTVANCSDCIYIERCLAPFGITCYDKVKAGTPITCKLGVSLGLDPITHQPYTYQWSARDSDDNDLSASLTRQGEYVSIPTKGLGGKAVITTVEVKELDPSCNRTAQGVTLVKP